MENNINYPIFRKDKKDGFIVKFSSIENIEVVMHKDYKMIGSKTTSHIAHTNTNIWDNVEYDDKLKLFDGQPVFVADTNDDYDFEIKIRFYDAINKSTFYPDGFRDSAKWDSYKPVPQELYNSLELIDKYYRLCF